MEEYEMLTCNIKDYSSTLFAKSYKYCMRRVTSKIMAASIPIKDYSE